MYYYQHHIGDYRRDTGHLTLLEHGIYRQLLDQYYLTEKPIDSATIRLLSVRNTDECESYYRVLADFFIERNGVYYHRRCDFEIEQFKTKSEKAKQSIKTRWNKNKGIPNHTDVLRTNNERNTNLLTKEPINLLTKDKTKKRESRLAVMPDGFNESVWKDFEATRKAKSSLLTETALTGIEREAVKAGISLEAALRISCERGWQSFKSDWINKTKGNANGKFDHVAATRRLMESAVAEEKLDPRSSEPLRYDVQPPISIAKR